MRSTTPTPLRQSVLADRIPAYELELLHRRGTVVSIEDGTPVIRQNSIGREWLVVLEGELDVCKDSSHVGSLNNGDFAGELSLLTSQPRNATVTTAGGETFLYAYSRQEFSSLLDAAPKLAKLVLTTAVGRVNSAA